MPALEYPHIRSATGAEPARLDRLPRVRVAQIVADHLGYGWSAEEIARQHPDLTPAEIYSAFAYYFDHRSEIEAELEAELIMLGESSEALPSPLRLRLLAARRSRGA